MRFHEIAHRLRDDRTQVVLRSPAEESAGLRHVGDAAVAVFVTRSIEFFAGDAHYLGAGIAGEPELLVKDRYHQLGEALDRGLILGRAEVEDLAVADAAGIVEDAHDALDGVVDVGVAR